MTDEDEFQKFLWRDRTVWRAFFFAVGIMLLVVGVECLLIDTATLGKARIETVEVPGNWFEEPKTVEVEKGGKKINPPEWMPWSFLFSGAVVVLYSFSLPTRWGGGS